MILSKDFNNDIALYPSLDNAGDNLRALIILKLLAGKGMKNLQVKWYSNDEVKSEEGNQSRTSHGKFIEVDLTHLPSLLSYTITSFKKAIRELIRRNSRSKPSK